MRLRPSAACCLITLPCSGSTGGLPFASEGAPGPGAYGGRSGRCCGSCACTVRTRGGISRRQEKARPPPLVHAGAIRVKGLGLHLLMPAGLQAALPGQVVKGGPIQQWPLLQRVALCKLLRTHTESAQQAASRHGKAASQTAVGVMLPARPACSHAMAPAPSSMRRIKHLLTCHLLPCVPGSRRSYDRQVRASKAQRVHELHHKLSLQSVAAPGGRGAVIKACALRKARRPLLLRLAVQQRLQLILV